MDAEDKRHYETRAKVIRAMPHPRRLLIIDELSKSKRCVCELTGSVGSDTLTVSRPLSQMKNAGFLTDEKRGD